MFNVSNRFELITHSHYALGKMYGDVQEEESSIDVSSPRDNNSPIVSELSLFQ